MDIAQVLNALTQVSLFELYRLNVVIDQQLRDPKRLQAIKNVLRVGQTVEYFVAADHRTVPARIEKLQRTQTAVINLSGCRAKPPILASHYSYPPKYPLSTDELNILNRKNKF